MGPLRFLVVIALIEFTGCSDDSEPVPRLPEPATTLSPPETHVPPDLASYPDVCDKAQIVVINGRRLRLPVECNPEYRYVGDPPDLRSR